MVWEPIRLLPRSIATVGLVAHIITSKYRDALPPYRLEGVFPRVRVELCRVGMARWVVVCAQCVVPVLEQTGNTA